MLITSIALSGIAIALFTLALILARRPLRHPEFLLMAWITALALNQAYFIMTGAGEIWSGAPGALTPATSPAGLHVTSAQPPSAGAAAFLHLFGTALPLIHAPLLYLFCRHVFSDGVPLRAVVHAVPFLLYMLVFSLVLAVDPGRIGFRHGFIWFAQPLFPLHHYGLFLALIAGGYTLAALGSLRATKRRLSETQSGEIRNVLNWLEYWIPAALLFFVATWLIIELSVSAGPVEPQQTFQIVSVFLSMYIAFVCFWSIRNTGAFRQFGAVDWADDGTSGGGRGSRVQPQDQAQLTSAITDAITGGELYLDPDFSLSRLSGILDEPPGKLSHAINHHLGTNFYDLVNGYRIDAFIRRLRGGKDAHLSLLGLAFDCGFRSKSTFNAFFKRKTGMTPSAFRKKLGKESG